MRAWVSALFYFVCIIIVRGVVLLSVAYFALPDFTKIDFYKKLYEDTINHPEMFRGDSRISCIYGNFFPSIWQGGRHYPAYSKFCWREDVEATVKYYNEVLEVPLRLTFTNTLLSREDIYDKYSNMVAEICHTGLNEILVANPILEEYLRGKFPNYKYCRSILASFTAESYDIEGKYSLSVMNRKKNNDWEYLDAIPQHRRSSVEFLCNERCPDDCPYYDRDHYLKVNTSNLSFSKSEQFHECINPKNVNYHSYLDNMSSISRESIDKDYLPRGFNQFKIEGRYNLVATAQGIADYLAIPEYRDTVFCRLLDSFKKDI